MPPESQPSPDANPLEEFRDGSLSLLAALENVSNSLKVKHFQREALADVGTTYAEMGQFDLAGSIERRLKGGTTPVITVRLSIARMLAQAGEYDRAIARASRIGTDGREIHPRNEAFEDIAVAAVRNHDDHVAEDLLPEIEPRAQKKAALNVVMTQLLTRNALGAAWMSEEYLCDEELAELMAETGYVNDAVLLAKDLPMDEGFWVRAAASLQFDAVERAIELLGKVPPSERFEALVEMGLARKKRGMDFAQCVEAAQQLCRCNITAPAMMKLLELKVAAGLPYGALADDLYTAIDPLSPRERGLHMADLFLKTGNVERALMELCDGGKDRNSVEKIRSMIRWLGAQKRYDDARRMTHCLPRKEGLIERSNIASQLAVSGRLDDARQMLPHIRRPGLKYGVRMYMAARLASDGDPNSAIQELSDIHDPRTRINALSKAATIVQPGKYALPLFDTAIEETDRLKVDHDRIEIFAAIANRQVETGYTPLSTWERAIPSLDAIRRRHETNDETWKSISVFLGTVRDEAVRVLSDARPAIG